MAMAAVRFTWVSMMIPAPPASVCAWRRDNAAGVRVRLFHVKQIVMGITFRPLRAGIIL